MSLEAAARRVVITGIGVVSPFGDRERTWRRLCAGESALRWIPALNGAGAPALPPEPCTGEPVVDLALHAAAAAVADAGLEGGIPRDAGCVIGTSKGGLRSFAGIRGSGIGVRESGRGVGDSGIGSASHLNGTTPEHRTPNSEPRTPNPDRSGWGTFPPNAAALHVASRYGLEGPALCPVAACATGLAALIRAADLIRHGDCELVLAGSTDASLEPILLASYRRLGVLARSAPETASRACRPFSRDREGFAVGEGSAVFVLESRDSALARGARIYAEWLGDSLASEALHVTRLDADPAGLTWVIGDALRRAGVAPGEIDYVNFHGTATEQNDLCETRAVRSAFGTAASMVAGSSLKGALGHLLGAAASVETAMTVLALRDGLIPPTAHLVDPDPDCDLDCVPLRSRRRPVRTALKLSLGFGGHLAAAVIRAPE